MSESHSLGWPSGANTTVVHMRRVTVPFPVTGYMCPITEFLECLVKNQQKGLMGLEESSILVVRRSGVSLLKGQMCHGLLLPSQHGLRIAACGSHKGNSCRDCPVLLNTSEDGSIRSPASLPWPHSIMVWGYSCGLQLQCSVKEAEVRAFLECSKEDIIIFPLLPQNTQHL